MINLETFWVPEFARSAFSPSLPNILQKTEVEERFLVNTEANVSMLSTEFQEIFTKFQETKFWAMLVNKIIQGRNESQLSGEFFEILSYFFLQTIIQKDQFLLSPEETRNLFKGVRRIDESESTPDGILFRKEARGTIICAFFEYKIAKFFEEKQNNQAQHYQDRFDLEYAKFGRLLDHALLFSGKKFLPKDFPKNLFWEAPSQFKVVYVVPYDSSLNLNSIEVLRFPITYQEFGHLLNALLLDFGRKK